MSKILVTIKHTVPLMDYGNTIYEATQEIDVSAGDDMQLWQQTTIENVRVALADSILPLVEAEVERWMHILIKPMDGSPDNYMRKNSKVYQWFRLAYPDVEIPALGRIENERAMEIRRANPLMDLEASH